MVKRLSYRTYIYIVFALIVLISSWEGNVVNAAIVESSIPRESIRLRILANSDAPQDQWIKNIVRDEISGQIKEWAQQLTAVEQARFAVRNHLADIDQLVGQVLKLHGFTYDYQVELGDVPFPTKMYGTKIYPAGKYEALRVTIGSGEGNNWWCVLFPPLCFVDATTTRAIVKDAAATKQLQAAAQTDKSATENIADSNSVTDRSNDIQFRFFLWDLLQKLSRSVQGIFA